MKLVYFLKPMVLDGDDIAQEVAKHWVEPIAIGNPITLSLEMADQVAGKTYAKSGMAAGLPTERIVDIIQVLNEKPLQAFDLVLDRFFGGKENGVGYFDFPEGGGRYLLW